ncbi:MAG: DUF4251 domain-containing protein [Bacteroidales bacterium]|nr:DUF4251 domain-containing protein [Bacteroidales bacterium]
MKILKYLAIVLSAIVLCGSTANGSDVTIEVDYIYPQGAPAIPSSDRYRISIKDGKLDGYLPFFGTGSVAGFNPDDLSFHFEDCPVKIKEKKAKDRTVWKFDAESGCEKVPVVITIWDNGAAEIYIHSANRSSIRYSGQLL